MGWFPSNPGQESYSIHTYTWDADKRAENEEDFKNWLYTGKNSSITTSVIAAPLQPCKEFTAEYARRYSDQFLWARPARWGAPSLLAVDDPKWNHKIATSEISEDYSEEDLGKKNNPTEDYEPGGSSSFSHTFSDARNLFIERYDGFESHGEELPFFYTLQKSDEKEDVIILQLEKQFAKVKLIGDLNNDGLMEIVIEIEKWGSHKYVLYQLIGLSLSEVMSIQLPSSFIE